MLEKSQTKKLNLIVMDLKFVRQDLLPKQDKLQNYTLSQDQD